MESSQKTHDILEAVNAWLAVAGENLCDRATAELRKRMCASVEDEARRLEEAGLSRELALQQAMGQLGDPEVAKLTLDFKHLTKREFIQVGRFYYGTLGISYRKLLPALGLLLGMALLLLHSEIIGKYEFYNFVGFVLATLLLDAIVHLVKVVSDSIPILGMAGQWEKRSQHLRRQWIYLLFLINVQAIFLLDLLPGNLQDSFDDPTHFQSHYMVPILMNVSVIFYYKLVKQLVIKVEALENEGYEYVLLPGGKSRAA